MTQLQGAPHGLDFLAGPPPRPFSERVLMDEMQHQSCKMNCHIDDPAKSPECTPGQWSFDHDSPACQRCDSGSCDKKTAEQCKKYGSQMKAVCNVLNCVFSIKHDSCPLATGQPPDQHSCNQ